MISYSDSVGGPRGFAHDPAADAASRQQAWDDAVRVALRSVACDGRFPQSPQPDPSPQPSPSPGPSPQPPPPQPAWSPEDERQIQALIDGAMQRNGGDVERAFTDLREQRQKPENYHDTNLAIAADYLRARWETQKAGPGVAAAEVETYTALKRTVGVPQEGPGPVSPYSELQSEYMRRGVSDEAATMSPLELAWWASPIGFEWGKDRVVLDQLRGDAGGA